MEAKVKWKDVKSIGMVEKIIEKMTKFASKDATLFAKAVRGHWDIEVMHWYLDVLFKEDSHKVLNKTAKNELKCIEKNRFSHFKKWTPNTRKKVTSMRQKRVLLSMAFHKFYHLY